MWCWTKRWRCSRRDAVTPATGLHFAFASTFTILVCQPGPVAFQRARISGGSRNEIEVRAAPVFGRPRGRSICLAIAFPKIFGSTSLAGRARRKSASVQTGLSGSVLAALFLGFRGIKPYLSLCWPFAN